MLRLQIQWFRQQHRPGRFLHEQKCLDQVRLNLRVPTQNSTSDCQRTRTRSTEPAQRSGQAYTLTSDMHLEKISQLLITLLVESQVTKKQSNMEKGIILLFCLNQTNYGGYNLSAQRKGPLKRPHRNATPVMRHDKS
jgi:hypothetical protein